MSKKNHMVQDIKVTLSLLASIMGWLAIHLILAMLEILVWQMDIMCG